LLLSEGVHLTIVLSESFRSSLLLPLRMSRDNQGLQPQSHSTSNLIWKQKGKECREPDKLCNHCWERCHQEEDSALQPLY